ncbi:MAG TPA: hypothetical protein VEV38_07960 [Candidatus Eremiobacteraceae bacterium]|nr:hypothetical protein [Candidatus Eremiobacteraceae bacterium]
MSERLYVNCPFGKTPTFLNYYLDQIARESDADGAILRLEVPLSTFGVPTGLNIARDVIAHFAPPDEAYGLQRTAVTWKPEGGGPFPTFTGHLSVEQDERYGSSSLLLEGSYEPPFGPVGKAFDAALGRRIATATAHELLHALRRTIEDSWNLAKSSAPQTDGG